MPEKIKGAPLVSVIIPTYNYAKYINQAIESVFRQTYKNVELIIIDDDSQDDTAQVVRKYGNKLRYRKVAHGGVSKARNVGAKIAKGEYIVFLDADDVLTENFILRTFNIIKSQNKNVGYVYTQLKLFEADNVITQYPGFKLDWLKISNYVNSCVLIRSVIVKEFPYDTRLKVWEDWDYYLTLAENNIVGVLLNEPLLLYRKHQDGKSALDGFNSRQKTYSAHILRMKHWRMYGYIDTARHLVWYLSMRLRNR